MTSAVSRFKSVPAAGGLSIKDHLAVQSCEMPFRPLLCAKNKVTGEAILYRPNCRMWKCPYCSVQRGRYFMMIAATGHERLAEEGHKIQFCTITMPGHIRGTNAGIKRWRSAWPKLLRRIKRCSEHVAYIQVPEQHKDGAYHVHLLTTATITERWLKDNCASCGLGWKDEIELVESASKSAAYVAKYLTKHSHLLTWPKYLRRVNLSRNWPKPDEIEKNPNWSVERLTSNRTVRRWVSILKAEKWTVLAYTE